MKRGLNRESAVFQAARVRMGGAAKPVLRFLNSMYAPEIEEKSAARDLTENLRPASLASVASRAPSSFKPDVRLPTPAERFTKVQYDASVEELGRIRKKLAKPRLPANRIGRLTFEHYLRTECPE
jgi:hypothetical protein